MNTLIISFIGIFILSCEILYYTYLLDINETNIENNIRNGEENEALINTRIAFITLCFIIWIFALYFCLKIPNYTIINDLLYSNNFTIV